MTTACINSFLPSPLAHRKVHTGGQMLERSIKKTVKRMFFFCCKNNLNFYCRAIGLQGYSVVNQPEQYLLSNVGTTSPLCNRWVRNLWISWFTKFVHSIRHPTEAAMIRDESLLWVDSMSSIDSSWQYSEAAADKRERSSITSVC